MRYLIIFTALFVSLSCLSAADVQPVLSPPGVQPVADKIVWMTDFVAAKKLAKEQHKNLLMDFTGSDWCPWCMRLNAEVFSQPEFILAAKDFVFVEVDFPAAKAQSAALKAQNEALRDAYGIEGYPTILLTDADGKPYAKTGYQPGGAKAYIAHLASFKAP